MKLGDFWQDYGKIVLIVIALVLQAQLIGDDPVIRFLRYAIGYAIIGVCVWEIYQIGKRMGIFK